MPETGKGKVARLAILIFIIATNTLCVAIDRGRDRHTIELDGEYAYAEHRNYDCEGHLLNVQHHHQAAGRIAYSYQGRHGLIARASAAASYGRLADYSEDEHTYGSDYFMGGLNTRLGYDGKYVGFEVGGGVLIDDESRWFAYPTLVLKLGALDKAYLEGGFGVLDAPFDGRLAFAGMNFQLHSLEIRLGFAALGRVMPDLLEDSRDFDFSTNYGGYGLFSLHLSEKFFISFAFIAAKSPSFSLGLGFEL